MGVVKKRDTDENTLHPEAWGCRDWGSKDAPSNLSRLVPSPKSDSDP